MQRIIDIHAHAFPKDIAQKATDNVGNYYSIEMSGNGTLQDLLESAEKAHVDYVVFHSTATKASQVRNVNDWIAEHAGGKLIGFGTLHPDMDDVEGEFERIISLGLKGIKLHPDFQHFDADDPKMDRIYAAIGDRLPLLIHAGDENYDSSSPERLAHVLKKFPKLVMIAAHLGGYRRWKESLNCLIGKNLYIDTSSAIEYMDSSYATEIIRKHGTKRVVFGTDYPAAYHEEALEVFNKLDLDEQEIADILFNNAAGLLGIE
jgi:predicted TIM-barrel fold metal-dependent hydrolase